MQSKVSGKWKETCFRKESNKKKQKNYVRQYGSNSNNKNDEGSQESGSLTTNGRGLILLPYQDWNQLDEEVKTYVQEYNAKIKHGESTRDLKIPKGFSIGSKRRRVSSDKDEERDEDSHQSSLKKDSRDSNNRKKIQFQITDDKVTNNS
jgi:hypothetical protein